MDTSAPLAPAAVSAAIDHLVRFAPFDRMERAHLAWMAERLRVGYYGKGEEVLSPAGGPVARFYLIKQGVVQGEQGGSIWLELGEGECFPLGALLAHRAVTSVYRAREDTFCYELPASDFHDLVRLSPPFRDFCTRRIASLLEQSREVVQAQYARASAEQQSMASPLSAVLRRPPVTCPPSTPLREVLAVMQEKGIGSMVAVEDGAPAGIFTLHDVLSRVALAQLDLSAPLSAVMSRTLISLPPRAPAYEAALAMARHGVRHVLVTEGGRLRGVVSEKDLFALQRVGLRQISTAIRGAQDLDTLRQAAADIRQLARNMLAQGVGAEQLTSFISTLNDLLTQRIIELECERAGLAAFCRGHLCWLALGSEGRFEQTLATDQDNGLIFSTPQGSSPDQVRHALLPLARRINEALDACGFPLCPGKVMASNPQWCLSLEEWKETFAGWIHRGDKPVLLNATIFFDFRPLWGNHELAHDLRAWLTAKIRDARLFLRFMAENALGNRPPLGLVRDFVVGEAHTLDLKLNGVTPFVDAARIFALAAGVDETSTICRLRAAASAWRMEASEVEAWVEAFLFIQMLRLRRQQEQDQQGTALSNHVDPDTLNDLDRRILKEAFRQARKLQSRLAMDYQL